MRAKPLSTAHRERTSPVSAHEDRPRHGAKLPDQIGRAVIHFLPHTKGPVMSVTTRPTPAEVEAILAALPDEITNAGRELTLQIAPAVAGRHESTRPGTQRLCTAIAAAADEHKRLAIEAVNGELEDADEDGASPSQDAVRDRIRQLVSALPWWTADPSDPAAEQHSWGVSLGGDPRGCTVKLTGPREVYDSFGSDGVCVPEAYY